MALAVSAVIFFNASIAFSARYSWTNPSSTAKSTITAIAIASTPCPKAAEMTAAASKMITKMFLNWASKMLIALVFELAFSSFGPYCSSRWAASSPDIPSGEEPRRLNTSSTSSAYH